MVVAGGCVCMRHLRGRIGQGVNEKLGNLPQMSRLLLIGSALEAAFTPVLGAAPWVQVGLLKLMRKE